MTVEDHGECSMSEVDELNVPVNLWLLEISDADRGEDETIPADHKWRLTAADYMPRKNRVMGQSYDITASTREELAALVREHILPLYAIAHEAVLGICDGKRESLYFWESKE